MSLSLYVENPEQADAVVLLRWCVSKDVLAILKSRGIVNPYLLLSIRREEEGERYTVKKEVRRILVPLEQAAEHIPFSGAGHYVIRGFIVWPDRGDHNARKLSNLLLSCRRSWGNYECRLHDYDGEFRKDYLQGLVGGTMEEAQLAINVGAEFFAPEPPAWENRWVNFWFEQPSRDQCQYRRRRLYAYSLKPVFAALYIVFILTVRAFYALLSLLIGHRSVCFTAVIRPFRKDMSDVVDMYEYWSARNNFFLTNAEGKRRGFQWLLIHPFFLIECGATVYLIHYYGGWALVRTTLLWITAFIAGSGIGLGIKEYVTHRWGKTINEWLLSRFSAEAVEERTERRRQLQQELEEQDRQEQLAAIELRFSDVVCTGTSPPVTISALSPRRRTIRLRYTAFKAKVCRPFARA